MDVPPKAVRQQIATVMIRAYAAHSYIYYEHDESIIPDGDFDDLCESLLEGFKWIKPFDLNNYLDKDSLKAGTGFHLKGKIVGQTRDYAESILSDHREGKAPPKVKGEKSTKKPIPKDCEDLL